MKNVLLKKTGLVLLSCAALAALASCSKKEEAKADEQELVVLSWGGALEDAEREAIFKPFEQQYHVRIREASPPDYGKIKAMIDEGKPEYDVMNVDADFVPRALRQNLLEKLDFSVIDSTDLDPETVTPYSVGAEIFGNNITYNTKVFSEANHPHTWAEFWDVKKFPGGRTFQKRPTPLLEMALLADGVPLDSVYPIDVDRAFKSLDKIKPYVKTWWETGAQSVQLLTDNEVPLGMLWSGRVLTAQSQNMPVALEKNQCVLALDSWVIPRGTKKKDLAMKFIAFATSAKVDAAYATAYPYAPINLKSYDLLSDSAKEKLTTNPQVRKTQLMTNVNWWVDNFDAVNDRFQKWLLE